MVAPSDLSQPSSVARGQRNLRHPLRSSIVPRAFVSKNIAGEENMSEERADCNGRCVIPPSSSNSSPMVVLPLSPHQIKSSVPLPPTCYHEKEGRHDIRLLPGFLRHERKGGDKDVSSKKTDDATKHVVKSSMKGGLLFFLGGGSGEKPKISSILKEGYATGGGDENNKGHGGTALRDKAVTGVVDSRRRNRKSGTLRFLPGRVQKELMRRMIYDFGSDNANTSAGADGSNGYNTAKESGSSNDRHRHGGRKETRRSAHNEQTSDDIEPPPTLSLTESRRQKINPSHSVQVPIRNNEREGRRGLRLQHALPGFLHRGDRKERAAEHVLSKKKALSERNKSRISRESGGRLGILLGKRRAQKNHRRRWVDNAGKHDDDLLSMDGGMFVSVASTITEENLAAIMASNPSFGELSSITVKVNPASIIETDTCRVEGCGVAWGNLYVGIQQ